ncbi:gephyrin-like molybdotransferase Glp [Dichotomicrobium thermohalophilum]|uniref:Molybdopterin molybdenumtransferase n=1 Tax=Dichotomicrobium thermohalophilum TaxID=933063 RepID=A0A397Q660_9HYPH|nr:gephyrin-like molybdotransferase Glp [Dichotomicrobium thermohalophilum]RIA56443.1 molybdopterin molybdotransferase [Dichotomicrobium thermohalophilum]
MSLLPFDDALARILDGVEPLDAEEVDVADAARRVLAEDIHARLTQPPFDASSMDGFALRAADIAEVPANLRLIGEAAAGHGFDGSVGPGEAVRIFTGGPVPEGADTVLMQENATLEAETVTVNEGADKGAAVRPRGQDFAEGERLLPAGKRLNARDVLLAAAANHARLPVRRKPRVAILATGDELVPPGETPRPDQIISSVPTGLSAMLEAAGAAPKRLGIAEDTRESLDAHLAEAADTDLLLTIGGASVGEHDLVREALMDAGFEIDFWRIAMRPGKPLMFGTRGETRVIGLPGNPVSAMVCTRVFAFPLIDALLGADTGPERMRQATLDRALEGNGPRKHYMRARMRIDPDTGALKVAALPSQDSALVAALASADCLIVREPHAPAARPGDKVDILPLDF